MKIKHKFSLFTVLYSLLLLALLLGIFSINSIQSRRNEVYDFTESNLVALSEAIEHELSHFVQIVNIIIANDMVIDILNESNGEYELMDETTRATTISYLNQSWVEADNYTDPIIQDMLTSDISFYIFYSINNLSI